ncbi:MAG: HEAT repeat domain-containing protein, partial [Terriglobus roseus]|nr:HEAT repeat domain-containing protein [Terriglobus roseus]
MADSSDATVASLRKILTAESEPLARRFRALFSLKHLASQQPPTKRTIPAIEAIAAALPSPSELLKHELAYCLGQSRNPAAIVILRRSLEDENEAEICRHEAAEALGALGDEDSLPLLRRLRDSPNTPVVIRETCEIAVARLEWQRGGGAGESIAAS